MRIVKENEEMTASYIKVIAVSGNELIFVPEEDFLADGKHIMSYILDDKAFLHIFWKKCDDRRLVKQVIIDEQKIIALEIKE